MRIMGTFWEFITGGSSDDEQRDGDFQREKARTEARIADEISSCKSRGMSNVQIAGRLGQIAGREADPGKRKLWNVAGAQVASKKEPSRPPNDI